MPTEPVIVEVYADFACPWCYVGMRRFRRALDGFDGVRTVHRPFQLEATLSGPAVPLVPALVDRFGQEGTDVNLRDVGAAGAEVGIGFRFDRALLVNTLDAHRLACLAGRDEDPDVQADVVERLFAAYFTEGRDVSDHAELAEVAIRSGMDGDRVAAYLASDEDVADVKAAVTRACRIGIAELPTYVFPGGHRLAGSAYTSDYRLTLDQVEAAVRG